MNGVIFIPVYSLVYLKCIYVNLIRHLPAASIFEIKTLLVFVDSSLVE